MTTLPLRQTIQEIQAVNAGVTGVQSVPTLYPSRLNSADLPLVTVLPGEGEVSEASLGLTREMRIFNIDVYVKPVAQGVLGNNINEAIDLLEAMRDVWANEALNGAPSLTYVEFIEYPIADTGVTMLEFADVLYHGIRFTLRTIAK